MNAPKALLRRLFDAAVAAADPSIVLSPHLPSPPRGRTIVLGAGKAAAKMARTVEDHWDAPFEGMAVTRYGHAVACRRIAIWEAAHPVPDEGGVAAAREILRRATAAGADDLVLCLLSGGGSALLTLPAEGLTIDDKRAVTEALLARGATIDAVNCVRKHLSAIKGGRLAAAAAPAATLTLAISDVPGDDPAVIASGPTAPDPSSRADAVDILARYAIDPPAAVSRHLGATASESPKPGDPALAGARYRLIATPRMALDAAARAAAAEGVHAVILGDAVEGESRTVARLHADRAKLEARKTGGPAVLLSGGETTVTGAGERRGGPNTEYALALALALDGAPRIHAIACDTDGQDGSGDNAGAHVTPDTLVRARAAGIAPARMLDEHASYAFFKPLGDLVTTGPTLTNVNDFRAILIA